MAEVSSVATTPIAPAQVSAPQTEAKVETAKAEAAPVSAPPAQSSEIGAGIAQATPTDSQAKKLYMTA